MRHLDSLGNEQAIVAGDVNWMTAGKGIVHSERSPTAERQKGAKLFGIQSWVALPENAEEIDPGFFHHNQSNLPTLEADGIDVRLNADTKLPISAEHEERGIYIVEGEIDIAGESFEAGRLLVFRPGDEITIKGRQPSRLMLLGGEPMDGPRYIWWNFVSSSKERIEQAKEDWIQRRFDIVPGNEEEFTPLPS